MCIVKKEDLEKLQLCNFSGRGFQPQNRRGLLKALNATHIDSDKYNLREQIIEKYNIMKNVEEYKQLLEGPTV